MPSLSPLLQAHIPSTRPLAGPYQCQAFSSSGPLSCCLLCVECASPRLAAPSFTHAASHQIPAYPRDPGQPSIQHCRPPAPLSLPLQSLPDACPLSVVRIPHELLTAWHLRQCSPHWMLSWAAVTSAEPVTGAHVKTTPPSSLLSPHPAR